LIDNSDLASILHTQPTRLERLVKIIPNVNCTGQWNRLLYNDIVNSIILYGTFIWRIAVQVVNYRRKSKADLCLVT